MKGDVDESFEALLNDLKRYKEHILKENSLAMESGRYDVARETLDQAEAVAKLIGKVKGVEEEWKGIKGGKFKKLPVAPPGLGFTGEMMVIHGKGVEAKGCMTSEGFVVMAGSEAVPKETPSVPGNVSKLRTDLYKSGVLVSDGKAFKFTKDHIFSSPSAAAGVVLGRAASGPEEWKPESK